MCTHHAYLNTHINPLAYIRASVGFREIIPQIPEVQKRDENGAFFPTSHF